MSAPATIVRDTANYRVTHYDRAPGLLTIVFVSAGRLAPGEPVEEFKRTLERFETSIVFVTDLQAHWFNYAESTALWAELQAIARRYPRVATIGESMGGSGAILAHRELGQVDRTLAMSPQYSILKPFIDFDRRYEATSRAIGRHRYVHFAEAPEPARCVTLFGNIEWRDYLHSAMFAGHGFDPVYLDGATHNVAAFLKARPGNGLVRLVTAFLDLTRPFTADTVRALFPDIATRRGMHPNANFATESTGHNHTLVNDLADRFREDTGTPLGPDLALRRPATQSSHSQWSRGSTPERDAAGLVGGVITGSYAHHTGQENRPWWSVDLGAECRVQEVRLFNFIAEPAIMARSAALNLLFSGDGRTWTPVFSRTDPAPFGGADGHPLIWRPGLQQTTRHLRIELAGPTYLHLDQVQVFGHKL